MIRRRAASLVRLVVLTLNEEPDIRRCLASVAWACLGGGLRLN